MLANLKPVFLVVHFSVLCTGSDANATEQVTISSPGENGLEDIQLVPPNQPDSASVGELEPGYEFESRTGQWYKFHTEGAKWTVANRTCAAEGAHLAVINSRTEAVVLSDLHQKYLGRIHDADWTYWVAIGIYRELAEGDGSGRWEARGSWKTVDGQTLDQAGYGKWYRGHPWAYDETRYGFLFYGFLASFDDGRKAAFICEK